MISIIFRQAGNCEKQWIAQRFWKRAGLSVYSVYDELAGLLFIDSHNIISYNIYERISYENNIKYFDILCRDASLYDATDKCSQQALECNKV